MPSKRVLKEGDILGMDFGVIVDGFYGDAAVTVAVGQVSEAAEHLMQVTRDSLYRGIDELREGKRLGDLSSAIQTMVEDAGFSVVREFVGHGIGKKLEIRVCAKAWSWPSNRWSMLGILRWSLKRMDGQRSRRIEA